MISGSSPSSGTDGHRKLCVRLVWGSRRFDAVWLDCEVEINEEAFVLLFRKHYVTDRDITM